MRRPYLPTLLILLALAGPVSARTWYITPDGMGDAPTVQAAIDQAVDGDEILLADGVFSGNGNWNIDYLGKAIVVRSQSGYPDSCIFDCSATEASPRRAFHFHSGESRASTLEMVTIKNGYASGDLSEENGGAILCAFSSSPSINGCVFTGNAAERGGAIYIDQSEPSIGGCSFMADSAYHGGAVYFKECSADIQDCAFEGNRAHRYGGGIHCHFGAPTILNCQFRANRAGSGGGVSTVFAEPRIEYCSFVQNIALNEGGGGIAFHASEAALAIVDGCTFIENSAYYEWGGGGLLCDSSSPSISRCTFTSNSFVGTGPDAYGGGAICFTSSTSAVAECTLWGNSAEHGGGMCCVRSPLPTVERCVIASSVTGNGIWHHITSSGVTLYCTDIYGNAGGDWGGWIADQLGVNGNFSACPSFCNAEAGNLHLCDESPCAPGNHPDSAICGLIGAWPVGCSCGPTTAESTTWGSIKAMYR